MVSLGIVSVVPLTEPCVLRSTQPVKVSTRNFSWGKGGLCIRLTTYHPCSAETSRKSGALTYSEPLGPPQPVAGWPLLYMSIHSIVTSHSHYFCFILMFQHFASHCFWYSITQPLPAVDIPSHSHSLLLIFHHTATPCCWYSIAQPLPAVDIPSHSHSLLLIFHRTATPCCWYSIIQPLPDLTVSSYVISDTEVKKKLKKIVILTFVEWMMNFLMEDSRLRAFENRM